MRETRKAEIVEVRAKDDGSHSATIRIVTYGPIDQYNTSWASGVFKRSISAGKVPSVFSHDPSRPIGVVTDFRDSSSHLDAELNFLDFDSCPDARLSYEAMRKGAIPGISFAFDRHSEEQDPNDRSATRITDATLIEISPVLSAAIPGSRVLSVRSDIRVSPQFAADLLTKFAAGNIDLLEALTELKSGGTGEGAPPLEPPDAPQPVEPPKPSEPEKVEQPDPDETDILERLEALSRGNPKVKSRTEM